MRFGHQGESEKNLLRERVKQAGMWNTKTKVDPSHSHNDSLTKYDENEKKNLIIFEILKNIGN